MLELLGLLPLHKIYSFLNAKDLGNLAQCSKTLYNSVNFNSFWQKFCIEKKWTHFGIFYNDAINIVPSKSDVILNDNFCFWGKVYRFACRLERNITEGAYRVQPVCIDSYSGEYITGMCCNHCLVVIVTSKHRLLSYRMYSFVFVTFLQLVHPISCVTIVQDSLLIGLDNGNTLITDTSSFITQSILIGEECSIFALVSIDNWICVLHSNSHICVWSFITKMLMFTLDGHRDEIFCHSWFGDRWLVTGSWDCDAILWDIKSGLPALKFGDHSEAVSCVKMNCEHIVTGSFDGNVRIWNWRTNRLENILSASKEIYCLEISEERVIAGSSDSHLYIWRWNGDVLFSLSGHLGIIRHIKYLGNNILISAGDMRKIMIWNIDRGSCLNVLHRNPCQIGKILMMNFAIIVAPDTSNSHFYVLSFL